MLVRRIKKQRNDGEKNKLKYHEIQKNPMLQVKSEKSATILASLN